MDIQTRIAYALADFDYLLIQGLNLEAALRIASAENEISETALAARAGRGVSLQERRRQVILRAELDRQAASNLRARTLAQRGQTQRSQSRRGSRGSDLRQLDFDF